MRKPPTKAERDHYTKVVEIGCIICQQPAEIHHLLTGKGMGMKSSNMDVIPLCPNHHRNGGPGVAIHAGVKTWQDRLGSEREHLARVMEYLK